MTADLSALIEEEIQAVARQWSSPYRKGIIAGLESRIGISRQNPFSEKGPQNGRANRNWADGFIIGQTRTLRAKAQEG